MGLLSTLTASGMARELEQYPDKLRRAVSFGVRNSLVLMERHHQTKEIRPRSGQAAPVADQWTKRTGALAKSFTRYWSPGDLVGYYGSPLVYSRMMEEGGTIKPKNTKFLAIPLKAAKYGVGNGLSPKNYPDGVLFPITSKKGNHLLVKAQGAGIVPMFVLKSSVKIDPRRTLLRTEKATLKDVTKIMADAAILPLEGGA